VFLASPVDGIPEGRGNVVGCSSSIPRSGIEGRVPLQKDRPQKKKGCGGPAEKYVVSGFLVQGNGTRAKHESFGRENLRLGGTAFLKRENGEKEVR